MWLVIEFLSDLLNVLAVSLSRRTSFKTFIMHVSVPTQLCPHGERHSYAHTHMHAHKPFKILPFSFSCSSSPNHPSSATVVFIQSCVWRLLVTVSSNFPVIHSRTTDGSSPGWLCFFFFCFFFWCLHDLQTPHHQDVKWALGLCGRRGGGGATGFILFAAILAVAGVPRRDWTERSLHLWALWCTEQETGRLKGGLWKKQEVNIKKPRKLVFQGWREEF